MAGVLTGVRVLDFGRYIAGPYCGALLADLGADVIRIEKREGSEDRFLTPVLNHDSAKDREGALFLQMNRNKRGMTLDPMTARGRAIAHQLAASADVVIANLPPQTLKDMGLDYETLSAVNPRIILTTVSAFGHGGPYSDRVGFDGVAQAMSGSAWFSGSPTQPVRSQAPWVDFGTASLAALGTLAALMARDQTGKGQVVEGALLATAVTFFSGTLIEQGMLGLNRVGTLNRGQTAGPSDIVKCKDGWIIVLINGNQLFRRWAKLVGRPELEKDPRFLTDELRGNNGAVLSRITEDFCRDLTVAEALTAFEKGRVPAGPVYSPQQLLDDPHVNAIGLLEKVDYPGAERPAPLARTPVKLSDTPGTIRHRAPLLGEHTHEILAELGYSDKEIAALKDEGVV